MTKGDSLMISVETVNEILKIDDSYKAPDKLMQAMLNKESREAMFRKFLEIERDLSYDWFQSYYEQEHAERKGKKQDFTPMAVSDLLSKLVQDSDPHTFTDDTAGNGGMLIKAWRNNANPITTNPSEYWFVAKDLSDRSIPFLIFNFAIRGWNGLVYHGDILEQKYKNIYFIQNPDDNWVGFSEVNSVPRNNFDDEDKRWLGISEFYGDEVSHIESENSVVWDNQKKGQVSLFE